MKNSKNAGFTLIELLIALFILSVVLLAVSSMVYSVMRSTSSSKETSTATTLMQDKMEALKNTVLSSLTPGTDTVPLGHVNYVRTWSISTSGNIRTITVAVNWLSRGAHNVSMTTLRGD